MERIYLTSRYKLKPETDLKEFTQLVTECVHTVVRHCPNTLEYYWYFDEPDKEFVLRAKFSDSQALEHQLSYQKRNLLKMKEYAIMDIEIYGQVDDTTLHQFSLLNAKAFNFFQGISKDNRTIGQKIIR